VDRIAESGPFLALPVGCAGRARHAILLRVHARRLALHQIIRYSCVDLSRLEVPMPEDFLRAAREPPSASHAIAQVWRVARGRRRDGQATGDARRGRTTTVRRPPGDPPANQESVRRVRRTGRTRRVQSRANPFLWLWEPARGTAAGHPQTALGKADIKLPNMNVDRYGQWFMANGMWKAITNKLAYPVNTVNIECNAITGDCTVTSMEFISEALDQVDRIRTQSLRVVPWDKDMLIAKSGDESNITPTINVPAKDVTWTQESGVLASLDKDEELRRRSQWRSTLPSAVWTGSAEPDTLHPQRMTLKLVDGMNLSPPFDGGDLKAEHEALFKDKERYLALQTKNMIVR
jgi:hypothetical protein